MAQLLRSKLHNLSSFRLPPPALASKLLTSPDLRLNSWRWFTEDALYEYRGMSVTETDSGSCAANEHESPARVFKGAKGGQASKFVASEHPIRLDDRLNSSLGKLTELVPEKSEVRSSLLEMEKGNNCQTESNLRHSGEQIGQSSDDDWQQMVNSIRSMALKKKLKTEQTNNINIGGSPKVEKSKKVPEFSDIDLLQSDLQSRKEPLAASDRSMKISLSLRANQQSMKDRRAHDLSKDSFLKHNEEKASLDGFSERGDCKQLKDRQPNEEDSFDENEQISDWLKASKSEGISSHVRNHAKTKDASNSKGNDFSLKKLYEGLNFPNTSHSTSKNRSEDKSFSQSVRMMEGALKQDASVQGSSNSNGVAKPTYMVCVQNLPPSSNPSVVKASMAMYGEVVGFFKKSVRDRLNVYIQFKTPLAMENALASRKLHVGSKFCYIVRAENSIFTTVVRVSKIANETDEKEIWSVCGQYGKVDNVRKRTHGLFDVFYDAKELSNMPNILGSLSEVTFNRSTWVALPAPLLHPSVYKEFKKSPEGQTWVDVQVNQALYRIEAGLDAVSVLLQDLKELNTVAREY